MQAKTTSPNVSATPTCDTAPPPAFTMTAAVPAKTRANVPRASAVSILRNGMGTAGVGTGRASGGLERGAAIVRVRRARCNVPQTFVSGVDVEELHHTSLGRS